MKKNPIAPVDYDSKSSSTERHLLQDAMLLPDGLHNAGNNRIWIQVRNPHHSAVNYASDIFDGL